MTKIMLVLPCCMLLAFSSQTCESSRTVKQVKIGEIESTKADKGPAALPRCLVYKTRGDYTKKVPVLLNANKTAIVSYPAPSDIKLGNELTRPLCLDQGYLLDNRGLAPNVAFLDYSYETYSGLRKAPDPKELYKKIIDKNPLIELWDCGTRTPDNCDTKRLNKLIMEDFPGCNALLPRIKAPRL